MDRKTLGLIGVGVALYFLLKKKKKEYILTPPPGCTDPGAVNYNPDSIEDDGSCEYLPPEPIGVPGCTDPTALNYDSTATTNDGSCEFASQSQSQSQNQNQSQLLFLVVWIHQLQIMTHLQR